ncbi:transcriptional regulator, TetR family [Nocardia nova SH22a]|uniref:Transcriptional regulator, TetR family n=1 Tax=Nocardia nova SH22a TaxID=1415166 RepID=W5TRV0_9NOCA|nr:TetR/AcrR family transcriptional regulator [Nocardia nova]AHH19946.1 transcriptional regulator, TetR family [Nocardia nova SH22a]
MANGRQSAVRELDVLSAAYACFTRHGLHRTTMEDIARELRRTRPVVYRFVTDKNDAFRKVAANMLKTATAAAGDAARRDGTVAERVFGILDVKLGVAVKLHRDSPHHAEALLAEDTRLIADLAQDYIQALTDLTVGVLVETLPVAVARERTDILLALTRGLESDLKDPDRARRLLREAIVLICPEIADRPP